MLQYLLYSPCKNYGTMTACVQSGHHLITFDPNKRHVKVKLLLYTPEYLSVMEV